MHPAILMAGIEKKRGGGGGGGGGVDLDLQQGHFDSEF